MWAFRIRYHLRTADSCYFVTLTYAHSITRTKNGFFTLDKSHFQNYMKRIRKDLKQSKDTPFDKKAKYIVTGEYGTKHKRPHYHAILINIPFDLISRHWPYGFVDIKEITKDRIAYVFKYAHKPRRRKMDTHSRDDRVPEYLNFSQGIGKQWLDDPKNVLFHRQNINSPWITLDTGERIAIPRYYKERIFTEDERRRIAENTKNYAVTDEELTQKQDQELLLWKQEKIRLMHKKAKKEQL